MELTSFLLGVFHLCMFISFCHCQGHFENVALNKPCNMSSQRHAQPNCSGAVNGNTAGNYIPNGTNCISTNPSENSSWWEVNLGRPYSVCNITIWILPSESQRMLGVKVSIDSTLYFTFDNTSSSVEKLTILCEDNIHVTGTVIRLSKDNEALLQSYRTIRVCEVEVLICEDGSWGANCEDRCGNCNKSEVCDKVTGHCSDCSPGFVLPLCLSVSSREDDQASVGQVVGAAVGGVAALALTVALVFLLVRRHRSLQQQRTDAHVVGARDTTDTVAPTVRGRVDPQLPSGEPQAQEAELTGNSRMSTSSAYIELMEDPSLYDRLAMQRNQHIYAGLQNS